MQAMDDMALLREYAARDSEAAFATLVSRRVNFVYAAALRQVRDPELAGEITQAVFIILARKAGRMDAKTILSGWLFKTTRFVAMAERRAAVLRQQREREAQMQSEIQQSAPDPVWEQLSPLLDEALARLSEKDRQAVLLRFFEDKSLAEVGHSLGTGEDTARKRVARALEKMRHYFSKRGVSSTAAIIAGAISGNSVPAAPAGLAQAVTAVALAKGTAASSSTLTLIKGALKIVAWTKAKTAVVVGVAALLTVGTTTVIVHEYRHHPFSSTRELSSEVEAQYASYTGSTPEQGAKTFLEAVGREDWTEAAKFLPQETRNSPGGGAWNEYAGLQVLSLGKPFTGWVHGNKLSGVFVPFTIKLRNGKVKTSQLHFECNKPDKRWYVYGSL
jgi:RNA polymerase sigma factor (sigma-70 family)